VRRLALLIEESLYRGTQWVLFEPNDEALWANVRLVVGEFLEGLWRAGAVQGEKPDEAYFVRCGNDTMTQDDIDNGLVNIAVGFAPMRPAEFVDIRIRQLAERVDTEVVGHGTGEPGQRLNLPRSARSRRLLLRVEEPSRWRSWTRAESFLSARPTDRVFIIERTDGDGLVVFGDGEHGAVPLACSTIRATYWSGGGRGGNRPSGGSDRQTQR
jgi:hypothetical protein